MVSAVPESAHFPGICAAADSPRQLTAFKHFKHVSALVVDCAHESTQSRDPLLFDIGRWVWMSRASLRSCACKHQCTGPTDCEAAVHSCCLPAVRAAMCWRQSLCQLCITEQIASSAVHVIEEASACDGGQRQKCCIICECPFHPLRGFAEI